MGGRLCTEWIPARPGPRLAWPSRGTVTRETRGSRPHRPHPQTFPPSCSPDLSTTTAAFMSMFVLVLTALDRTIHATPIDLFSPQHICLLLIYLPLPFPTAAFPTSAPPAPAHMPHHNLQFLQCKRALRPTARLYPFEACCPSNLTWTSVASSSSDVYMCTYHSERVALSLTRRRRIHFI